MLVEAVFFIRIVSLVALASSLSMCFYKLSTHTEIFNILMENDTNILTTIKEEPHDDLSHNINSSNDEPSSSSFQDFVDEGKNYV